MPSLDTNSGTVLSRIVEARREEVARRKRIFPETMLRMAVQKADAVRDFAGMLGRDGINIIAEIKRASPSAGVLRPNFDPPALALGFQEAGAAALSVLTEEDNFQGALSYLRDARKTVSLPVLRKDFIVEPWQVWETRAANADTFLLIVAALALKSWRRCWLWAASWAWRLWWRFTPPPELRVALDAGARIIGVNNRDLHTLEVNVATSLALIEADSRGMHRSE